MKFLKKLKQFILSDFTVLIIPKTTKTTKQIRLNSLATYTFIVGFIILNIFVSITSVTYYNRSQALDSQNTDLSTKVNSNLELIASLEKRTSLQDDEIIELINENEDVLEYLNTRIADVNDLYNEMTTVIASFNEENNSDISVPISRSLDRTSIQAIENYQNEDDEDAELDIEEIKKQDELSSLIASMKEESSSLRTEIEDELEYLDCLPDNVPLEGRISSGFGYRRHPITGLRSFHYGVDITGNRGDAVQAAGSGVITFAGWSGDFGKVVIISHGFGYETVYAHNDSIIVKVGDVVNKGDLISRVGSTGRSTGPHLHFEIHYNNEQVDPIGVLRYDN
ncbi:M23 family metallopeptidase [Acidaminobacter sp. JC074]|uniref:M23 family metallopeptidase n=1 Tax=Acidaminobacter sp. JC074 TaxID=2530199 RepID=UPI001F0E4A6C|nr:M23 family metallopeptidase [Acidaminobacter sp. JC074]MCH4890748.1 M23 family metallopeptidase [Acidaminobacter sp. JC074]